MHLLDVSVWVAAASAGHVHHHIARTWLEGQHEALAFCRVTQMSVLRNLTNPAVMQRDVVTRRQAWVIFDQFMQDERVLLLPEPERFVDIWRTLSARDDRNHRVWTDDYLAAFAQAASATFVTFDRAIQARYPSVSVLTLG